MQILSISLSHFSYLGILLLCSAFPIFFVIIHKRMLKQYHFSLFPPTMFLAAIPFLGWDILATSWGHWQFNPTYTTPWTFIGLPLEEFLFFLLIPQSSMLIWVALKRYSSGEKISKDILQHFQRGKK